MTRILAHSRFPAVSRPRRCFKSIPGPNFGAIYTATNAQIARSLGRSLSGGVQTCRSTSYNNNYGTNGATWQRPTSTFDARLVKFGAQLDF